MQNGCSSKIEDGDEDLDMITVLVEREEIQQEQEGSVDGEIRSEKY